MKRISIAKITLSDVLLIFSMVCIAAFSFNFGRITGYDSGYLDAKQAAIQQEQETNDRLRKVVRDNPRPEYGKGNGPKPLYVVQPVTSYGP